MGNIDYPIPARRGKYTISNRKDRNYRHLIISPELHVLIKDYAKRNDTTMIDAAYILITTGLIQIEELEVSGKPNTIDYIISREVARQLKEKLP